MISADEAVTFGEVPLEVEAELDRKPMTMRDILALAPGAVLKLSRSAGENIDLLIGGAPAGSGEIVMIEEMVGVRITDFGEGEQT